MTLSSWIIITKILKNSKNLKNDIETKETKCFTLKEFHDVFLYSFILFNVIYEIYNLCINIISFINELCFLNHTHTYRTRFLYFIFDISM